jgi:hypothetical protein
MIDVSHIPIDHLLDCSSFFGWMRYAGVYNTPLRGGSRASLRAYAIRPYMVARRSSSVVRRPSLTLRLCPQTDHKYPLHRYRQCVP